MSDNSQANKNDREGSDLLSRVIALQDEIAIRDTIQRYGVAVDEGRFELFEEIFDAGAHLDYSSAGGPAGEPALILEWLRTNRAGLVFWQHHLSPPVVALAGDVARARTDVYTPITYRDGEGRRQVLNTGGRYHDELHRADEGWRIVERRYESTWTEGVGTGEILPDPLEVTSFNSPG